MSQNLSSAAVVIGALRVNMFIDGQYPFTVNFSSKTYIVSAKWKCLITSHEHHNKVSMIR